MEIQELWRVVKKRLVMILVLTVMAAASSAILSRFVLARQYAGTATLIVVPHGSAQDLLTSMVTGQQLVDTYASLVTTRPVLETAMKSLGWTAPTSRLAKDIVATPKANTDFVEITVKEPTAAWAARVANAVAKATVAEATRIDGGQTDLQIVAQAVPARHAVDPDIKTNVAVAVALGLMTGSGLAFLLEYLDDSLHTEEEAKRYLDMAVLSAIPLIKDGKGVAGPSSRTAGQRAETKKEKKQRRARRVSAPPRVERGL